MRATTRTTVILFLSANLALWIFFWVDFSRRLVPYKKHPPAFEEALPVFVFGGKALPTEQMRTPSLRLMQRVQMPSFLVVRPVVYTLNQKPSAWERTFGGISPWGYLLIVVMFLSFLQWYVLARLVGWLIPRLWRTYLYNAADLSVRRGPR